MRTFLFRIERVQVTPIECFSLFSLHNFLSFRYIVYIGFKVVLLLGDPPIVGGTYIPLTAAAH